MAITIKRSKFKHKYGAKRCEKFGLKFPSKLEMHCFEVLKDYWTNGKILFFLRQIGFDLPGKHRHFVDFQVFTAKNVYFIEAKGRDLSVGKNKRDQVEDIYKIDVHTVKNDNELKVLLSDILEDEQHA